MRVGTADQLVEIEGVFRHLVDDHRRELHLRSGQGRGAPRQTFAAMARLPVKIRMRVRRVSHEVKEYPSRSGSGQGLLEAKDQGGCLGRHHSMAGVQLTSKAVKSTACSSCIQLTTFAGGVTWGFNGQTWALNE